MTGPDAQAAAARAAIFASIERVADLLDRTAARTERERTLCREALDALHDVGLFGMWVPREAGGLAADLATQVDALIELAHADMSAAWTLMIGNTVTGTMAACLPDAGFAEVFTGPRMPVAAGALRATGKAVPTATGGYRVTGTWGFGSGIHHAEWIVANCRVDGGESMGASPARMSASPSSSASPTFQLPTTGTHPACAAAAAAATRCATWTCRPGASSANASAAVPSPPPQARDCRSNMQRSR